MRPIHPKKRQAIIDALKAEKETQTAIAERFQVNINTVGRIASENGLGRRKRVSASTNLSNGVSASTKTGVDPQRYIEPLLVGSRVLSQMREAYLQSENDYLHRLLTAFTNDAIDSAKLKELYKNRPTIK